MRTAREDLNNIPWMTIEEINRILEWTDKRTSGMILAEPRGNNGRIKYDPLRFKAMFLISYRHGLRRGELNNIRMNHINLDKNSFFIHRLKSSRSLTYQLQPDVSVLLESWIKRRELFYARDRDPNGYFFPSSVTGGRMAHNVAPGMLDVILHELRMADKGYTFHSFRFSIAMHLLQAGVPLVEIADWLGHKSITSTMKYLMVTNPMRDQLSKRISLDRAFAGVGGVRRR